MFIEWEKTSKNLIYFKNKKNNKKIICPFCYECCCNNKRVYEMDKFDPKDDSNYLLEIQRLNQEKETIEEDLNYYKELNTKFIENETRKIELEKDNSRLKNLINELKNEMNNEKKKMEKEY